MHPVQVHIILIQASRDIPHPPLDPDLVNSKLEVNMLFPPPLAIKRNIRKSLKKSRLKPQISHDDRFNETFISNLLSTLRVP
jgi:hypothetical protein